MSMFKGFSNAFRIPELRKKILITLGLVALCRLISQVPTPGVDWQALNRAIEHIREQRQEIEESRDREPLEQRAQRARESAEAILGAEAPELDL